MTEEQIAVQAGQYDEALAAARAEVDRLVKILQVLIADVGEPRAAADVCALVSERGPAEVAGLLTAALLRLAGENEERS